MRQLEISARAEADILAAYVWLSRHNPAAARRWRVAITRKFDILVAMPGIGSPRHDYMPLLRAVVVRPYAIYFRADERVVRIVRVIHGSRDHDAILRGED